MDIDTTKYSFNDTPICPWCDHKIEDACEYELGQDESLETECENCGKEIEITAHWSINYSTESIGCAKHLLVPQYYFVSSGLHQYVCKLCKKSYYERDMPSGKYPKIKEDEFEIVKGE